MIFSDKNRYLYIGVATALILVGCFYGAWQGPREDPSPQDFLENPDNIGREAVIRYAKVLAVSDSRLLLRAVGYEFTAVFTDSLQAKAGNDISLVGKVESPTTLQVTDYHIHPWRPLKYYFSLPAIGLVIYILFKKYRFNWRRLIFTEK